MLGSFNASGGVGIWVIPAEIGIWQGFEWCGGKIWAWRGQDTSRGMDLELEGSQGLRRKTQRKFSKSCNPGVPPPAASQPFISTLSPLFNLPEALMECQEGGNGVSLLE